MKKTIAVCFVLLFSGSAALMAQDSLSTKNPPPGFADTIPMKNDTSDKKWKKDKMKMDKKKNDWKDSTKTTLDTLRKEH